MSENEGNVELKLAVRTPRIKIQRAFRRILNTTFGRHDGWQTYELF
jgi:hypothetical protein